MKFENMFNFEKIRDNREGHKKGLALRACMAVTLGVLCEINKEEKRSTAKFLSAVKDNIREAHNVLDIVDPEGEMAGEIEKVIKDGFKKFF